MKVLRELKLFSNFFFSNSIKTRSSLPEVFCKKDVLRNFAKFTRKHLCQSVFFNKVAGLSRATLLKRRLWRRCFPLNFVKFLTTPVVAASVKLFFQKEILNCYCLGKHKWSIAYLDKALKETATGTEPNIAMIVGILVGIIILIAVVAVVVIVLLLRKRKFRMEETYQSNTKAGRWGRFFSKSWRKFAFLKKS